MKTYPMRARIRNEGDGPARVDIYDDIGAGGWFSEGFTPASFAAAIKDVSGPLDIHINSGGGDVADGIAIKNAISSYPGRKRTVVDGLAASIASVIAQAGDERIVEPGAMLMIHDPLTYAMGNAADMRKVADTLDKHGDNLASIYAARAGGTVEQWRQVMQGEAWYTADEAVAAGLADRVGSAAAKLPAGVDVEQLAARAPGRIMAALRSMPKAAGSAPDGGDDDEGGGEPCKTCGGSGRLKHPGTGKNGMKCPGCDGTGTYDPDAADDDPDDPGGDNEPEGEPDSGMQDRARGARNQAGKPYEPQPYHRTSDETVQCPACQKYGDDDSRYCGQCGTQLTGRTDVKEAALPPAARAGIDPAALRAFFRDELRSAGLLLGADGYVQRADHFYQPLNAADVDNSDWDGGKAMAGGVDADDPAAFYEGICAGKKDGNPRNQSSWALPYRYKPDGPVNAAGVKNALARLPQTQGLTNEAEAKATLEKAMKVVNPDYEPEDSTDTSISAAHALERYRAALKGATA